MCPYIPPRDRPELEPGLRVLVKDLTDANFTPARLNYVICRLANAYVEHWGLRYDVLKDVKGVMIGALGEFLARVVTPYEEKKLDENGTVWSCIEEQEHQLTNAEIDALMIYDENGWSWMKCSEGDCDLKVTGPGRVQCDNCDKELE